MFPATDIVAEVDMMYAGGRIFLRYKTNTNRRHNHRNIFFYIGTLHNQ